MTDITKSENFLKFDLKLGEYYKNWLTYGILTAITLGLYHFYGTNKLRKFVTDKFSLNGINFEYTGRARELFYGFIVIMLIVNLPQILFLIYLALGFHPDLGVVFGVKYLIWNSQEEVGLVLANNPELVMLHLIANLYNIIVGSLIILMSIFFMARYRATRTKWNGYSAYIKGNAFKYALLYIASFLSIFTLNILSPYFLLKRKRYVWENTFVGDKKIFVQETNSIDLMKINLLTTLLMIPTLGIARTWYWAAVDRYIYSKLEIENIRFESTVQGSSLACLWITNLILLVITFGLAIPYITKRTMEYYCNTHKIIGDLDNLNILKDNSNMPANDYGFYNFSSWNSIYFSFGSI